MVSAMLSAFGVIVLGLGGALLALRHSERRRGEASIRATNAVLAAEARARARMAAAEAGAPRSRDDLVQRLRARGEI